jgi:LPS export ABC transporter protein LptC
MFATVVTLGACQETAQPVVSTNPMADTADQMMFGARSIITDRGLLRAELLADTAFFFDENTRIEMRDVRVTFYTTQGERNAVLTGREGTYNTRVGLMEARGNVVVVSEDGRRLTSEQLRYDQRRNEIASDSAFVLTEQTGRRIEGIGFTSDPQMDNIRCLRACSGIGGPVTVPTQ